MASRLGRYYSCCFVLDLLSVLSYIDCNIIYLAVKAVDMLWVCCETGRGACIALDRSTTTCRLSFKLITAVAALHF